MHHDSKRPTRFKSENMLVHAYLDQFRNREATHKLITELESSNGIADVVHVHLRKGCKGASRIGEISPRWAYTLHSLPTRKPFSVEELSQIAGSSVSAARSALRSFESAGFCARHSQTHNWIKTSSPRPIANKIIAIEAKLSDWRRALTQAYRYQDYAMESWVLLDEASSGPAKNNIDAFVRLNVGLVTLGIEGSLQTIFSPKQSKPKSEIQHWHIMSQIDRELLEK